MRPTRGSLLAAFERIEPDTPERLHALRIAAKKLRYGLELAVDGGPEARAGQVVLENADVTAEIDSIGDFWLEEMGVDGFRIDAARHLIEDGRKLENTDATFDWLEIRRAQMS